MVENGKSPEGETRVGSENLEGGQEANQSGGSSAEPELGQNRFTHLESSRAEVGTGSRTDSNPISSGVQEKLSVATQRP